MELKFYEKPSSRKGLMVFSIYFVHFSFNYKAALSRYWLASCSDRLEIIIRRNRSKWKEMKNNFLSKGCNIRCPPPPPPPAV